jgi:hypothetical protein
MRHAKDFSKKPINIGQKWRKKDAPVAQEVRQRGRSARWKARKLSRAAYASAKPTARKPLRDLLAHWWKAKKAEQPKD